MPRQPFPILSVTGRDEVLRLCLGVQLLALKKVKRTIEVNDADDLDDGVRMSCSTHIYFPYILHPRYDCTKCNELVKTQISFTFPRLINLLRILKQNVTNIHIVDSFD